MKNFVKRLGFIALAAVIFFSMAACDSGTDGIDKSDGGSESSTVTYKATNSSALYTLNVSSAKTVHAVGDAYTLTVKRNGTEKTSSGKVTIVSGSNISVQPKYKDAPTFIVTVSGASIIKITGIITFDDGSTEQGPGTFTSGGGGGGGGNIGTNNGGTNNGGSNNGGTGNTGGTGGDGDGSDGYGVVGKTSTGKNLIRMDTAMVNSKLVSISDYSSYDTTLVFNNLDAKYMPAPGDIINSGISMPAPYGFLYKVKSVSTSGGITTITTELATFEEALVDADIEESFDLFFVDDGEEEEGVTVELISDSNQRAVFKPFPKVKISLDKRVDSELRLKGELELSATANFDLKIGFAKINHFELSATPRFKGDIGVTIGGGNLKKEKIVKIKTFTFPAIHIPLVIDVVVVPELTLEAVISLEGEVGLQATLASWDYSATFGVQKLNGGKLEAFKNDKSEKPLKFLDEIQVGLSGEVKAGPKVSFKFGLYGAAFGGMSAGFYGKIEGKTGLSAISANANAELSLSFVLELGVETELKILSYEIGSLTLIFYDDEWTLWERTFLNVYNQYTWNAAVDKIKGGGNDKSYNVYVTGNFSIPGVTANTFGTVTGLNVTIAWNKTITLTGQGSLLYIGANQTAVIRDTDFKGNSSNNKVLICVDGANASLTMEGSSSVSDNTCADRGSGVYFSSANGTFRMVTGSIYGTDNASLKNTATTGAALYNNYNTAERGIFNSSSWTSIAPLSTTNNTIRVADGVLQ